MLLNYKYKVKFIVCLINSPLKVKLNIMLKCHFDSLMISGRYIRIFDS